MSDEIEDLWFTDRRLPIMAMSADTENDRVLKVFFRRPVTREDRDNLIAAQNALLKEPELLSLLTASEARAEAAEARVKYLQIIIDCVVANCEASASSYQERIETIHRVTSALALEWAEGSAPKGTPDGR